eukprot:5793465-Pyramimonas_sp.AAC.2
MFALDVESGLEDEVGVGELLVRGEVAGRDGLHVAHLVHGAELGEVALVLGLAHLRLHLQVAVHLARVQEGVLRRLGGVAEGRQHGQPQVVLDVLPVELLALQPQGDRVVGVVDVEGALRAAAHTAL